MYMAVVLICKQLHILISFSLVVDDIRSKSWYKRPVVLFNLPVSLKTIRRGRERFHS